MCDERGVRADGRLVLEPVIYTTPANSGFVGAARRHEPGRFAQVLLAVSSRRSLPLISRSPAPCPSCPDTVVGPFQDRVVPVPRRSRREQAVANRCSFSGSSPDFDFAAGGADLHPFPSSTAWSRCGVTRVPPWRARGVDRHRYGRHRHVTLNRSPPTPFSGVPLLLEPSLLPLGRRHEADALVRRSMASSPEAEQRRPLVDLVDAGHVADRVEVHVHDCSMAWRRSIVPWPPFFQHLNGRRRTSRRRRSALESGVITPSCSAAVATAILNVEPASRFPGWPIVQRRSSSLMSDAHVSRSSPDGNAFDRRRDGW